MCLKLKDVISMVDRVGFFVSCKYTCVSNFGRIMEIHQRRHFLSYLVIQWWADLTTLSLFLGNGG